MKQKLEKVKKLSRNKSHLDHSYDSSPKPLFSFHQPSPLTPELPGTVKKSKSSNLLEGVITNIKIGGCKGL